MIKPGQRKIAKFTIFLHSSPCIQTEGHEGRVSLTILVNMSPSEARAVISNLVLYNSSFLHPTLAHDQKTHYFLNNDDRDSTTKWKVGKNNSCFFHRILTQSIFLRFRKIIVSLNFGRIK